MKSQGLKSPVYRNSRVTRRDRRVMQREEAHQKAHQKVQQKSRLSFSTNVGLVLTVLAVAAILGYAALRTQAATGSDGLTNPNALNTNGALLKVGQTAPNFTLSDTNGKTYNLASQRGHPVLLEFFAVWCPVCQGEAPIMSRLTSAYVPKGVRVWSVLANPYGPTYDVSNRSDLTLATRADLTWFADNFNVHHPQLIDPQFQTVNTYGVDSYPGLYVVDAKGVITYASVGHKNYTVLSQQLNRVLATSSHA